MCQDCRHLLEILEVSFPFKNKFLDGLYFSLSYKETELGKKLIRQFKYQPYLKALAPTLASILIEHFIKIGKNTNEIWENAVLIPVPLDKKKFKIRGYNQSEELAKEMAKIIKIPVISDFLIKTKYTRPQMELNKEEREKNLLGAFAINHVRNKLSNGTNQNIARFDVAMFSKVFLIDDVYTTGSTMQECAKVLKENGAKSVWGIALAREA